MNVKACFGCWALLCVTMGAGLGCSDSKLEQELLRWTFPCESDIACAPSYYCAPPAYHAQPTCVPDDYRLIPAGSFLMGSSEGEEDEAQVSVTLTRSFYLKESEVTQGEWRPLMGNNPDDFGTCGEDCPVEDVSWYEALEYLNALSNAEGLEHCYTLSGCTGTIGRDYTCSSVTWKKGLSCAGYRLPTEAEWEYAARGGTTGATYGPLNDIAWYGGNSFSQTHPVKQKQPNAYGLHDMIGNVWEWTWDGYEESLPGGSDPVGGGYSVSGSSASRVGRGCSWGDDLAMFCRAAYRGRYSPGLRASGLGLRPARSLSP